MKYLKFFENYREILFEEEAEINNNHFEWIKVTERYYKCKLDYFYLLKNIRSVHKLIM